MTRLDTAGFAAHVTRVVRMGALTQARRATEALRELDSALTGGTMLASFALRADAGLSDDGIAGLSDADIASALGVLTECGS